MDNHRTLLRIAATAVVLLLLTLAARSANADRSLGVGRRWALGIRVGMNRSKLTRAESSGESEAGYGVNLGAAWFLRLNEIVSVQAEIAFSDKVSADCYGSDCYGRSRPYIEVPLLVRVAPPWQVRPYGIAGLGPEFLIGDWVGTNSSDQAAIIGGGLERAFDEGLVFAEIRYWHGLNPALRAGEGYGSQSHRVLTFSVGFFR